MVDQFSLKEHNGIEEKQWGFAVMREEIIMWMLNAL